MSLRMPQFFSDGPRRESGLDVLSVELMAETASNLGRLGKGVEIALATLAAAPAVSPERDRLVKAASEAVWLYLIQLESSGLLDHSRVKRDFGIPTEVLHWHLHQLTGLADLKPLYGVRLHLQKLEYNNDIDPVVRWSMYGCEVQTTRFNLLAITNAPQDDPEGYDEFWERVCDGLRLETSISD